MADIISDVIEKVPEYKEFMTVEELDQSTFNLARKYPDLVTVFEAGKTRDGRPIYVLKIGNGRKKALLFGCPHPNEPVGTLVLEHLSWQLVENDEFREMFDYTWYIVKVADKDGLKLNEGWLKGPFTILNLSLIHI